MLGTAARISRHVCPTISVFTLPPSSELPLTSRLSLHVCRTSLALTFPPNTRAPHFAKRLVHTSSVTKRRSRDLFRLPAIGACAKIMENSTEVSADFSPPNGLKMMTELNRDLFVKIVHVPAIVVPQSLLNDARKKLWKYVLRIPKIVPIQDYSADEKVVLLDPKFIRSKKDCNAEVEKAISNIVDYEESFKVSELNLMYENWTADDILKAVLPEGENVSGYSITGHVVHFNLKPCHEPYKKLIGEVILDKLKTVRTVVNKTNTIDNVYRFFKMELVAGDDDMIVTVKENGCSFKFDFAKVYWNSRLGTEHERIVNKIQQGDLLYDVFAGVGPFSLPCARKGVTVLANDLNPESFKWLNENVKLNSSKKYPCKGIQTFNMDGRDFIKQIISEDLKDRNGFKGKIHIVMNLPGLAIEFLDAFVELYNDSEFPENIPEPTVHCYTFSKAETDDHDFVSDVRAKTEVALGCELPVDHVVRQVRNVAPNKDMMCVSFRLERNVLVEQNGPEMKKMKLDES